MASTVNIKLVTSADTSGADKTAAAVRKVEQATRAASATERQRADSLDKAAGSLNALPGAQVKSSGSNRNLGNALLQTSRGLQDMQYGLHGAVNNLEGIATALGLGAGVAGVVTVLAVAVQQLGPRVIEMLKSFDGAAQVQAGLEAVIGQLSGMPEPIDRASVAQDKFNQKIAAGEAAVRRANEALEDGLKLVQLQLAAQKSEVDFQTEEDVQDIKAQGLDPARERELIAQRKALGAERKKQLEDEEAIATLDNASRQRDVAGNAASAAEAEAARLIELQANTEKQIQLRKRELELTKEMDEYRSAMEGSGAEFQPQAIKDAWERMKAELEANQQQQRDSGPVGNLEDLQTQVPAAIADAQKKRTQAGDASREAAALAEQERIKAAERNRELERERQRIAREATPGVFDAKNLDLPSLPGVPAALPRAGEIPLPRPVQPGGTAGAPLPGSGRSSTQPPSGIDAGGFTANLDAATNATQQAATSGDQGNAAVVQFAETTTSEMERLRKSNDDMKRKLETLETRLKNQR